MRNLANPESTGSTSAIAVANQQPPSNAISTSMMKHDQHVLTSSDCTSHAEDTLASSTHYLNASNLKDNPANVSVVTATNQLPPSNAISISVMKHDKHVLLSTDCISHAEGTIASSINCLNSSNNSETTANALANAATQEPLFSNALSTNAMKHSEYTLSSFDCTNNEEINSCYNSSSGTSNTSVLDYSRDSRRQRIIEAVGSDPDQLCITDYYSSINNLEKLLQQNEKLSNMLKQFSVHVAGSEDNNVPYFDSFPDMLKQLISNAVSNAQKLPKGRRHPEIIKKFSTSVLIYSGPFTYNFLQQNLGLSLPSLRTVQSHVYSQ